MCSASVTVVSVTYNSANVIASSLGPVVADPNVAEIFVVDNNSSDNTQGVVQRSTSRAMILPQKENLGFGRACNLAIARATTPYILLLNPDAQLQEGALETLVKTLESYPDALLVSPLLKLPDGTWQENGKRDVFTREERGGGEWVCPSGPCSMSFIPAAVWLINREHFHALGGFDPEIFLFYEDDDLCLRAAQSGRNVLIVPEAEATHGLGQSGTHDKAAVLARSQALVSSRLYLEEKYHGTEAARKLAGRLLSKYRMKCWAYRLLWNREKTWRYMGRKKAVITYLNQGIKPESMAA